MFAPSSVRVSITDQLKYKNSSVHRSIPERLAPYLAAGLQLDTPGSLRHDLVKPHEGEQGEQLARRMAEPDLAAVPLCGELKPREGIDRHRVRVDPGHVAEDDTGTTSFQ